MFRLSCYNKKALKSSVKVAGEDAILLFSFVQLYSTVILQRYTSVLIT